MGKLSMTRRSFAKMAAVTAATATLSTTPLVALADASDSGQGDAEDDDIYVEKRDDGTKVVRTCCRACGKNECGVLVTVKDGVAIKVEGDAETAFHSMGNCCTKSQSSIQAAYHPDRIYHPMKRTNPKGSDDPGWVRITWDEAISTIAEKFQELKDKYGGESLFFMGGTSRIWTQHAYAAWPQLVARPTPLRPGRSARARATWPPTWSPSTPTPGWPRLTARAST